MDCPFEYLIYEKKYAQSRGFNPSRLKAVEKNGKDNEEEEEEEIIAWDNASEEFNLEVRWRVNA